MRRKTEPLTTWRCSQGGSDAASSVGVLTTGDLRDLARRRLPRAIFEYIDRGSEDDIAVQANREALDRVKIRPRTLIDVTNRDQSITLFGRTRKMPIIIAPTGGAGLAWYDAEILSRACGVQGRHPDRDYHGGNGADGKDRG